MKEQQEQQEFLTLCLEAAETGDNSKLAAHWRKHFPGYKWWCLGPDFPYILPDDGKDKCVDSEDGELNAALDAWAELRKREKAFLAQIQEIFFKDMDLQTAIQKAQEALASVKGGESWVTLIR